MDLNAVSRDRGPGKPAKIEKIPCFWWSDAETRPRQTAGTARQCLLVETGPSRVVIRQKPADPSAGCGHWVHQHALYLVCETTEPGLEPPSVTNGHFRTGRYRGTDGCRIGRDRRSRMTDFHAAGTRFCGPRMKLVASILRKQPGSDSQAASAVCGICGTSRYRQNN